MRMRDYSKNDKMEITVNVVPRSDVGSRTVRKHGE